MGFALAAILAIGALAASVASAQQGKLTSDGPVTLEGIETGEVVNNAYTTFGMGVECPGFSLTGHKYNVTPHEFISIGSTTLTITPHVKLGICYIGIGSPQPTTWLMNGCDYVLHIGTTVTADEYAVTTDLTCPPGKHVQLEQFNEHPGGVRLCTYTIKPQNGIAGPRLITNTAADDVNLAGTFKNIHLERSGLCGSATTATGEWHVDMTFKGKSTIGATTGITVTD